MILLQKLFKYYIRTDYIRENKINQNKILEIEEYLQGRIYETSIREYRVSGSEKTTFTVEEASYVRISGSSRVDIRINTESSVVIRASGSSKVNAVIENSDEVGVRASGSSEVILSEKTSVISKQKATGKSKIRPNTLIHRLRLKFNRFYNRLHRVYRSVLKF